jgi:formylmethanofuran dehydrogenase subunit C
MPLKLQYQAQTTIPVEIEGLTPDAIRDKTLAEIEQFPIFHGNQQLPLAELFRVSGDPSDGRMEFEGDLAGVHWIGAGMSSGQIHVAGSVGRHLGSEMKGGEIHVQGNASDWVGGEMHGGLIHVLGRAGHLVGAAYRGSRRGMTGGTILVGGDVGDEIGHTMRRGLLAVGGSAGDCAGFNMIAGTILVFGGSGIRPGAGMRRGTIGLFGAEPPRMLPSFRRGPVDQPLFLRLLLRELNRLGFSFAPELMSAEIQFYAGDFVAAGKGEILLRA